MGVCQSKGGPGTLRHAEDAPLPMPKSKKLREAPDVDGSTHGKEFLGRTGNALIKALPISLVTVPSTFTLQLLLRVPRQKVNTSSSFLFVAVFYFSPDENVTRSP